MSHGVIKISKFKYFSNNISYLDKKTSKRKMEAVKRQTTLYRTQIAIAGLKQHNPCLM